MKHLCIGLILAWASCADDAPDDAPEACPPSCDDHDTCAEDRCDPETFACVHVSREPSNACLTDQHCEDDGNECTRGTCVVDECGVIMPVGACQPGTFQPPGYCAFDVSA